MARRAAPRPRSVTRSWSQIPGTGFKCAFPGRRLVRAKGNGRSDWRRGEGTSFRGRAPPRGRTPGWERDPARGAARCGPVPLVPSPLPPAPLRGAHGSLLLPPRPWGPHSRNTSNSSGTVKLCGATQCLAQLSAAETRICRFRAQNKQRSGAATEHQTPSCVTPCSRPGAGNTWQTHRAVSRPAGTASGIRAPGQQLMTGLVHTTPSVDSTTAKSEAATRREGTQREGTLHGASSVGVIVEVRKSPHRACPVLHAGPLRRAVTHDWSRSLSAPAPSRPSCQQLAACPRGVGPRHVRCPKALSLQGTASHRRLICSHRLLVVSGAFLQRHDRPVWDRDATENYPVSYEQQQKKKTQCQLQQGMARRDGFVLPGLSLGGRGAAKAPMWRNCRGETGRPRGVSAFPLLTSRRLSAKTGASRKGKSKPTPHRHHRFLCLHPH